MNKRIKAAAVLLSACAISFGAAACAGQNSGAAEQPAIEYKGEMLYNGFDDIKDLYAVNQLYEWSFTPLGKLSIVSAEKFKELSAAKDGEEGKNEEDLSPRQGEGALRVYYEGGTFKEILARFDRSALAGLPADELGKISVQIYNDSAQEKNVSLSLMREKNKVLELENAEFVLAPYAWTTCEANFDPVITEYFKSELIGVNVRFYNVTESVYYIDDMKITFGKIYTEEINARLKKAEELENDISKLENKTITAADEEVLNELYSRYADFSGAYRAIVKNAETLFDAANSYFSAINEAEEEEGSGITTTLFADKVTGLGQFSEFNGGTISYTKEERYGEEAGAIKIDFNGSAKNTTIPITPTVATGYDEVRIKVKNDSDLKRAVYLDWETFDYAINEAGEKVNLAGGYVIPANSGWLELVFTVQTEITELNSASLSDYGNAVTSSEGTLYIGRCVAISHAGEVVRAIEALKDYSSPYSASDKEAVKSARASYDALCPESQEKITNISKLENLEAEIWKEGFKLLPASSEEITGYNAAYKTAADNLRSEYSKLSSNVKKLVAEEEKRLTEYENRINLFKADYVKQLISETEIKTDYSLKEIRNIREAEAKFGELTEEEKAKFAAAETEKLSALIKASEKYYTLKDLGGGFAADITGAPEWGAYSAELVNDKEGIIVFNVSGLKSVDGAFYISLFFDGSVNAGQASDGITCMFRNTSALKKLLFSNAGDKAIGYNGSVLSESETYTVYYGYKVNGDYSSVTISVKVADEAGTVQAEGSYEISEFKLTDFGSQTLESWLGGEGKESRKTFFISSGASGNLNILSAW